MICITHTLIISYLAQKCQYSSLIEFYTGPRSGYNLRRKGSPMPIAVGYIRKSSIKEGERTYSIQTQHEAIERVCGEYGYTLSRVYQDAAEGMNFSGMYENLRSNGFNKNSCRVYTTGARNRDSLSKPLRLMHGRESLYPVLRTQRRGGNHKRRFHGAVTTRPPGAQTHHILP